MTTYDLGAVVALAVAITDPAGAPADAGAVVLTITLPDGTTTTPTVSHPATGSYTATYTPAAVGAYRAHWVATGTNASAKVDSFVVADPTHTPAATYSGDPASSDLDRVRFLLMDTNVDSPLLSDEEITWLLDEWGTPYRAAANGAESLAARFAATADESKRIGDVSLSTSATSRAAVYAGLSRRLAQLAARSSPGIGWQHADAAEAASRFTSSQFDIG